MGLMHYKRRFVRVCVFFSGPTHFEHIKCTVYLTKLLKFYLFELMKFFHLGCREFITLCFASINLVFALILLLSGWFIFSHLFNSFQFFSLNIKFWPISEGNFNSFLGAYIIFLDSDILKTNTQWHFVYDRLYKMKIQRR